MMEPVPTAANGKPSPDTTRNPGGTVSPDGAWIKSPQFAGNVTWTYTGFLPKSSSASIQTPSTYRSGKPLHDGKNHLNYLWKVTNVCRDCGRVGPFDSLCQICRSKP